MHSIVSTNSSRFSRSLRVFRVRVELRPLVGPDAAPEPRLDAPLAQVVEDCDVLGQPDRMPPHHDTRHLTDADPRGAGREVGADQDRVRKVADTERREVVLADPHRVEAHLLGENHLLAKVVENPVGWHPGVRDDGEDRALHRACPRRIETEPAYRAGYAAPPWPPPRRSASTAWLALWPGTPVTVPPGQVEAPHEYSPGIGVR